VSGFPRRENWTYFDGYAVPNEAVTSGPHVEWKHIDGPFMTWAGDCHWLTFGERLRVFFGLATVDAIASERWPHIAKRRAALTAASETGVGT
jgi:hypothetical protein